MILTELELRTTAKAAAKFRSAAEELSQLPNVKTMSKKALQSHIRAMRRQAEELEAEIAEYELIKSGKVEIKVTSVFDLGKNLVNARIKLGMDRPTLARRLNVSENQILRNEARQYKVTPIAEILKTAKILNVKIPEDVLRQISTGKCAVF